MKGKRKTYSGDASTEAAELSSESEPKTKVMKRHNKFSVSAELKTMTQNQSDKRHQEKDKENPKRKNGETLELEELDNFDKEFSLDNDQKSYKFAGKKRSKDKTEEERTIFVGNVDANCGKRELITFFAKYGMVSNMLLLNDRKIPLSLSLCFPYYKPSRCDCRQL